MKLIVAEKPLAAARLAEILGKPKRVLKKGAECWLLPDSVVIPLKGHITNVDFPKEYSSWSTTGLEELVDAPVTYANTQQQINAVLEEYAKQTDELVVASDYDSEGESIGLEAIRIVKQVNPKIVIKRARFSALTPQEVKQAFEGLVNFDYNLADSADTRREVDLIWGAVLTRYVSLASRRLGKNFLSVGRVQTPTLSFVVNREKEIKAFVPKPFWVVSILCDKAGEKFPAVHEEDRIFEKGRAEKLAAVKAKQAAVQSVAKEEIESKPPAPFNTTEFLRAASSLGFQPEHAMNIAEKLYMQGFTSYPRVDNTVYPESLNLREILGKLEKNAELGKLATKISAQKKLVPTVGKRKATDHPPIHPVDAADKSKLSAQEWKVYELICRRFFATLAPASRSESVKAVLNCGGEKFVARGRRVLEEGWREYYPYLKIEEVILPALAEGEKVSVDKVDLKKDETKPRPRFSPGALIKQLESAGLGTKSTRHSIIQKLVDRGYLQGQQSFTPSQIAFAVISTLEEYSPDITKPVMTAKLEHEMQQVEKGKKIKSRVVADSRKILHKALVALLEKQPEISQKLQTALQAEYVLGKCPDCEGNLRIIRTMRGTRFVGCTGYAKGCRRSFPLPAKGSIKNLNKACDKCNLPMIEVQYFKRRPFQMCVNPQCESKKDWVKKPAKPAQAAPTEAPAEAPAEKSKPKAAKKATKRAAKPKPTEKTKQAE